MNTLLAVEILGAIVIIMAVVILIMARLLIKAVHRLNEEEERWRNRYGL